MRGIIYFIFNLYANLIFIHVILSWVPGARQSRFGLLVSSLVEPYLSVIRSFIPGMRVLDFSPIIGYLLIELAMIGVLSLF